MSLESMTKSLMLGDYSFSFRLQRFQFRILNSVLAWKINISCSCRYMPMPLFHAISIPISIDAFDFDLRKKSSTTAVIITKIGIDISDEQ